MIVITVYFIVMIKNEVNKLDNQLTQVKKIIAKKENNISPLKAAIARGSAAPQLKLIAEKYLQLQPIQGSQFRTNIMQAVEKDQR